MDSNDYEPVVRDEWIEEFMAESRLTRHVPDVRGKGRKEILQAKQLLLRARDTLDREIAQLDDLLLERIDRPR